MNQNPHAQVKVSLLRASASCSRKKEGLGKSVRKGPFSDIKLSFSRLKSMGRVSYTYESFSRQSKPKLKTNPNFKPN
jgi:hypothetical protein